MRPPILSKYPVDEIVADLKKSKDQEKWIIRFLPQILSKDKLNANAISVTKRISLLKTEPISKEDLDRLNKYFKELKREDLIIIRQIDSRQQRVIIFCAHDDAPETIDGLERHIYRVIPNAKLKFGASDINRDRCRIVKKKTWKKEIDRPTGVYAISDLSG